MARRHGEFASVREAILTTAASLFTRRGVHGTSLGDIAAEAKLSKGTLYYYYPTKDELIITITENCLNRMSDILLTWLDGLTRDEPLAPAITRLFSSIMEDEQLARLYVVLCAECSTEDTPIQALMAEQRQQWKLMLELGTLRIQSRNARILGDRAELFFTLLTGHMLQSFGGMSSIPVEALTEALVRE